MTVPPDPLEAAQRFLRADTDVLALLSGNADRVSTRELTREVAEVMGSGAPRKQVLLQQVGGPGDASRLEFGHVRIDAKSYGETPREAALLDRAVVNAFKQLERRIEAGQALLHDALIETRGIPARERELNDAPLVFSSFLVTTSEVVPA